MRILSNLIWLCLSASLCLFLGIVIAIASSLITRCSRADNPFEVQNLNLEYHQFFDGGRYPLITGNSLLPNKKIDKEISLTLNTDIYNYLYWNNKINAYTDSTTLVNESGGQFRTVAWEFHFGARVTKFLNLEYAHRSEHLLDSSYPTGFPVQDSVGVVIKLISNEHKEGYF